MKSNVIFLFACFAPLLLSGCGNHLSKSSSAKIIDQAMRTQPNAERAMGFAHQIIGTAVGYDTPHGCASDLPSDVETASLYERAGILTHSRLEPCRWEITILPNFVGDLYGSALEGIPAPGKSNMVSLVVSRYAGVKVTKVEQDGLHAKVTVERQYKFTETGKALAKSEIFPELYSPDCKYDLPAGGVTCSDVVPMAFFDGMWQIDRSNMK